MQLNPFSAHRCPAIGGSRGAVAAAHPLAAAAAQEVMARGGNAADAVVAGQAALAVLAPDACGLGGDVFVLLREPSGAVTAVNGAGPAPMGAKAGASDGGASVTAPGLVDGWVELARRWGRLGLGEALAPAIRLAEAGVRLDAGVVAARDAQAARLRAGGAGEWALMGAAVGERLVQPHLAASLQAVAEGGRAGFYEGALGAAIVSAARRHGGALGLDDLAPSAAEVGAAITVRFAGHLVHVQPPASQGILLGMALAAWERAAFGAGVDADHVGVELTQAAFDFRDSVARGAALLDEVLEIDRTRASRRGGPRSYLHTAGVAASDDTGLVATSLVSVFDDFGSGVFVPEGGFVLNNRGGGFTEGDNAFAPGRRPVHTLAPALVEGPAGVVGLATPGADGQVQTLLQVLVGWLGGGADLSARIAAPRWRSEDGRLLVEAGHPARERLVAAGHAVVEGAAGDMRFGAVTAAGFTQGHPFAIADWRRTSWAGVA